MRIFTQSHCSRLMLVIPAAVIGLIGTAQGATIDLGTLLANPSFENGNQAPNPTVGCPVSWTCGGSPTPGFTSYTVTSAQYVPGADGLSGLRVTPDGTHAGSTPTTIEGSGYAQQTSGLGTYVAGNTYMLSFWAGRPLTEPDGVTPVTGFEPDVRAFLLSNGVTGPLGGQGLVTISDPGAGQWAFYTLSFNAIAGGAYIGQNIGVEFYNGGTAGLGNNLSVNFDIAPAVPEPSSVVLMFSGLGLAGLALVRRRRLAQS
jgi:hypothetical protein